MLQILNRTRIPKIEIPTQMSETPFTGQPSYQETKTLDDSETYKRHNAPACPISLRMLSHTLPKMASENIDLPVRLGNFSKLSHFQITPIALAPIVERSGLNALQSRRAIGLPSSGRPQTAAAALDGYS